MSDLVRIALQPLGAVVEAPLGAPLRELLFAHGVEFPCGGRGRCRGCRVKVLAGSAPAGPEHAALLSPAELASGWRLACQLRAAPGLVLELAQWELSVLGDESRFEFTPVEGYGIAIDLGTTTLVAQLVDLAAGAVLGVETALNPQVRYGSDVMSRIQHALDPAGAADLRRSIREELGALSARVSRTAKSVTRIAIVGNTAMHHLFCGLDASPLARAPFETPYLDSRAYRKSDLAWDLTGDPEIRFLPCIGGFVGSDVLAGIVATGLGKSSSAEALIDLGTNGEIVVAAGGRMLCASTAAGPAFEGGGISCGMRAATGAIVEVSADHGSLRPRVLGGGPARGICGSGLVDAAAVALDLGLVLPTGRLPGGKLPLAPGLELRQRDIRELQLAKGALAAGVEILLARLEVPPAAVSRVHLAGAFGNYVNRASAARIGLIEFPADVVHPAGNTALLGAKLALFSPNFDCAGFEAVRRRVSHVPLAADPRFEDTYVANMSFPR
jgi:uncharacterized 2Fe-2S/4Fe-4S cluster protein (DUF4445 family)